MALPVGVRKFFGHALDFVQRGEQHDAAKVLKGFSSATPKPDMNTIRERLKVAEQVAQEMRDEKAKN
jgi:hypothetical protein